MAPPPDPTLCFRRLATFPPNPQPPARPPLASGSWGLCPQTPKHSPPIANFWLRAWHTLQTYIVCLYLMFLWLIYLTVKKIEEVYVLADPQNLG